MHSCLDCQSMQCPISKLLQIKQWKQLERCLFFGLQVPSRCEGYITDPPPPSNKRRPSFHYVFTWQKEQGSSLGYFFFPGVSFTGTIPFMRAHHPYDLITFQRPLPLNTSTMLTRVQHVNSEETQTFCLCTPPT